MHPEKLLLNHILISLKNSNLNNEIN